MAIFPALKPSLRTFTPGEYPNTAFKAWSGIEGRVRHSNVMLDSSLRLTFNGITEAQMVSILSHYTAQRGTYESFTLPTDVLVGLSSITDFSPTAYRWRYNGAPQITDLPGGSRTVELSLVTVPAEGVTLSGGEFRTLFTIVGGVVRVSNGINATTTLSFQPGAGDAPVNAPGGSLTANTSLAFAGATGGAAVSGITSAISTSFSYSPAITLIEDFGLTAVVEDDLLDLGF